MDGWMTSCGKCRCIYPCNLLEVVSGMSVPVLFGCLSSCVATKTCRMALQMRIVLPSASTLGIPKSKDIAILVVIY